MDNIVKNMLIKGSWTDGKEYPYLTLPRRATDSLGRRGGGASEAPPKKSIMEGV